MVIHVPVLTVALFLWKCMDYFYFYRTMLRRARYCYDKSPGYLSIRLSVTLTYRDHIGRNSSKIISPLVSRGCSLSADPNITDLLQGEHLRNFGRNRGGVRKMAFSVHVQKLWLSLKCGKIRIRLLLRTNRKSHTRFRLVPKSTTFDDLEGHYALCFKTCAQWCCNLFLVLHSICF